MRILSVLTYYRPHTSGLTIYAERLAKALVKRGHEVTILTTQYDKALPREDISDGVRIVRVPVVMRISKGVVAPTMGVVASRLIKSHDVVQLHLPQLDAAVVAIRAKIARRPVVLTFHCDLILPPGVANAVANATLQLANNVAAICSDRIITYTEDYAINSIFISRYKNKLGIIPPPVELPKSPQAGLRPLASRLGDRRRSPTIGMAARLASEKGVEVLLRALPRIIDRYPDAQVLFAGQHENVFGEAKYARRLQPSIEAFTRSGHWRFVGVLEPMEMADFYSYLDVLVVPSLNSTESFGLVQIEAMMNGVPCVASDLPGVRQPISMTGMGQVVSVGNTDRLAEAILRILEDPGAYRGDPDAIARMFHPNTTASSYETLFASLTTRKGVEA
jgi:glycosyltransferase involved in cell wall biosynthesis